MSHRPLWDTDGKPFSPTDATACVGIQCSKKNGCMRFMEIVKAKVNKVQVTAQHAHLCSWEGETRYKDNFYKPMK